VFVISELFVIPYCQSFHLLVILTLSVVEGEESTHFAFDRS